ncbi:hypothetical protein Csa_010772 [Cucumis sativus]|uniref:Uncharacterized protein n=1 Tax=Cucumis sativus TaxID=3659 RepID=A0A0A0L6B1_CUCSA|nr:hypothetical protein Csa_010772 [Cucumis sativus]
MVCGISLRRKRVAVFLCGGTFRALVLRGAARKKEKLSGNSNSTGSYTGCPTRLHPTSISCCEDTCARKVEAHLARTILVDQSETSTPGLS